MSMLANAQNPAYVLFRRDFGGAVREGSDAFWSADVYARCAGTALSSLGIDPTIRIDHDSDGWYVEIRIQTELGRLARMLGAELGRLAREELLAKQPDAPPGEVDCAEKNASDREVALCVASGLEWTRERHAATFSATAPTAGDLTVIEYLIRSHDEARQVLGSGMASIREARLQALEIARARHLVVRIERQTSVGEGDIAPIEICRGAVEIA